MVYSPGPRRLRFASHSWRHVDTDWLLPEIEAILSLLTKQFINIGTAFHSIQFALTNKTDKNKEQLAQELELWFAELIPCLQTMLILVRVRRDVFEKYTPIFNPLVGLMECCHCRSRSSSLSGACYTRPPPSSATTCLSSSSASSFFRCTSLTASPPIFSFRDPTITSPSLF